MSDGWEQEVVANAKSALKKVLVAVFNEVLVGKLLRGSFSAGYPVYYIQGYNTTEDR